MATFKICINKQRYRPKGTNTVYIRVSHKGKSQYIKTDKIVTAKGLSKKLEVTDPFVLRELSGTIAGYIDRLNRANSSLWTVTQMVEYLLHGDEDLSFSAYAREYINQLINKRGQQSARNYIMALKNMETYFGTDRVLFSMLNSLSVNMWIESLMKTARAKEMYPISIRHIYRDAMNKLNDYDTGEIRIKMNPWAKVKIPKCDIPTKKAISAEACRAFFAAPLPPSRNEVPQSELGRDVAMMVFCLAGINTVDLYNMRKSDYHGGIIRYMRAKTRHRRRDEAYIEMRVPEIILPLFDKYRADDDKDNLFTFSERYNTSYSFASNINAGIRIVCKFLGIKKEDSYCVYTFRHSWATIAQNDCRATLSEIGFAMNHSQQQTRVTRGYVKLDFSPAWELNEKVIDFVFFSDARSKLEDNPEPKSFHLSPKVFIRAAAFYKGHRLASFEDIGYSSIDEVTRKLAAEFPDDIPLRSSVLFKIVDLDTEQVLVYERTKGEGF